MLKSKNILPSKTNVQFLQGYIEMIDKLIQNNELSTAIENQDSITSHRIFNSILYS